VLLPRASDVVAIGGPGFEFFVDGRNYDEGGKAQTMGDDKRRGIEPGAWRLEVMPNRDALEDQFLVVMLPSSLDGRPAHTVRLLEEGERVGCEIRGPNRTTRWWFTPRVRGVTVEVADATGTRRQQIGTMHQDVEETGFRAWFDRLLDELTRQ
jgi:hypothetical protein